MFSYFIYYIGSIFLGWGLGANDSANIFGTAVSSRMINYKTAVFCTAFFVIIGAVLQGAPAINTLAHSLSGPSSKKEVSQEVSKAQESNKVKGVNSKNESQGPIEEHKGIEEAMIMSFAAAIAVFIMTLLKLPVSTSQAIVGAIVGLGIMKNNVNIEGLEKVIICWVTTPVGGVIFTLIFYFLFKKIFNILNLSLLYYDFVMKSLLLLVGCYGAYALGANNVANVAAVFVKSGSLTVQQAALFGGITIAIGVISYSKPVMETVGKNIIKLDAFMAFITVLSLAVTVYIYALIGVPVSTTQAIVGAVIGLGIIKGVQTVNYKTIFNIVAAWIFTPVVGGVIGAFGYFISNLQYIG